MVQGAGFRVQGAPLSYYIAGLKDQGLGSEVECLVFRAQGAGLKVQGAGFKVQGAGHASVVECRVDIPGPKVQALGSEVGC